MARARARSGLLAADRRGSQGIGDDQGRDASPNGDVLVEQILENRNTPSPEDALKMIASLPPIRRSKVLNIRRQIAAGSYEVANRLDQAIDRVLESLTA